MKLATCRDCTRDGALIVVSSDDTRWLRAEGTLQDALDEWDSHAPLLNALAQRLAAGEG